MITVDEARARILERMDVLPAEEAPILEAIGRVLDEDVHAEASIPPFANSAMDGYAVRAADTVGAGKDSPRKLTVLEDVAAGHLPTKRVGAGEAIRIMTGAPRPEGADAVVMVERTRRADGAVEILAEVRSGENVRPVGEDVSEGDVVLSRGKVLRAGDIGMLAAVGRPRVRVIRRPVVSILATGDELVELDEPLSPGKIRNSNAYSIAAQVLEAGGVPHLLGIAQDTAEDLGVKIKEGLASDLIITSGGVSVGDYDFVKDVLDDLGQMLFWQVAMKPAKPLAFGVISGKPIFGLPGNPTSSMVSFEQFVRPTILKMGGHSTLARMEATAVIDQPIRKREGRRYFVRVTLSQRDGELHARLSGPQGSGMLRAMTLAQGLLVLTEDRGDIEAGERGPVQLLYPEDMEG